LTYCLAIRVDQGLVFCSDSRTNAGVDQVSTYSKMHVFDERPERAVSILSSGNLATTQAVIRRLRRDNDSQARGCINKAADLAQVAEYVGRLSRTEQRKHASRSEAEKFNPEASFIVGGYVAGRTHQVYLVYPEGNYIAATLQTPYLQIGESKYGKPILDRIINEDVSLEVAARCALVSMDSTMRSNVTVGPPIELLIYTAGANNFNRRLKFAEDNPYLHELRQAWQQRLKDAFEGLPSLPLQRPAVQLVDARSDS
jgi:putative proteasome-type protease